MILQPVTMSFLSDTVNGMIEKLFMTNLADEARDILSTNVFTDYSGLGTVIQNIYNNVILPVAIMVVVIYFLANIIDKSLAFDDTSWVQFIRNGMILVACVLILNNGYAILSGLSDIGAALFSNVETAAAIGSETFSPDIDVLRQEICGGNRLGDDIKGLITLFIPWALSSVFPIIVKAICYMRIIEIAVRACLMPIALADFFQSGLHGSGWRSLKAFFAVCLQAVTIYLTMYLNVVILNDVLPSLSGIGFVGAYLAIWAATIGLLFKSQGLIKEIVGA